MEWFVVFVVLIVVLLSLVSMSVLRRKTSDLRTVSKALAKGGSSTELGESLFRLDSVMSLAIAMLPSVFLCWSNKQQQKHLLCAEVEQWQQ